MLGTPSLPLGVLLLGATYTAVLALDPETLEARNVTLVTSSGAGITFALSEGVGVWFEASEAIAVQVEP